LNVPCKSATVWTGEVPRPAIWIVTGEKGGNPLPWITNTVSPSPSGWLTHTPGAPLAAGVVVHSAGGCSCPPPGRPAGGPACCWLVCCVLPVPVAVTSGLGLLAPGPRSAYPMAPAATTTRAAIAQPAQAGRRRPAAPGPRPGRAPSGSVSGAIPASSDGPSPGCEPESGRAAQPAWPPDDPCEPLSCDPLNAAGDSKPGSAVCDPDVASSPATLGMLAAGTPEPSVLPPTTSSSSSSPAAPGPTAPGLRWYSPMSAMAVSGR
jgi:hypothetical protein